MIIDAKNIDYKNLNDALREADENLEIVNCLGQRFIAAGVSDKRIKIQGIPGNALGAYLNGAVIEVMGNAQDAVGDTMNNGEIIIHGNVGDAVGYAMRGGKIFVQGNAGYRAGIHMKAYREKQPVIVIGGKCGSFLGEYQAGGTIIVLGLTDDDKNIVGNFPCTGMHGGKMYLRGKCENVKFPKGVNVQKATDEDMKDILPYIKSFSERFNYDEKKILNSDFMQITPDSKNPYKQMYVAN